VSPTHLLLDLLADLPGVSALLCNRVACTCSSKDVLCSTMYQIDTNTVNQFVLRLIASSPGHVSTYCYSIIPF
jgi:hypothetical protein